MSEYKPTLTKEQKKYRRAALRQLLGTRKISPKHQNVGINRLMLEKTVYEKKSRTKRFGWVGQGIENEKKNLNKLNEKAKIKSQQRYNRSTLLKKRRGGGGVPIDLKTSGTSPWSKSYHKTLK